MASVDYLLVAAIDFGTTYSGYAFLDRDTFMTNPTDSYLKQWTDSITNMVSSKTSTCALFNNDKKLIKFGFEAEEKYLELLLDNEQKNHYFFRRFKMSLYQSKSNTEKIILEDINGRSMSAMEVFSASIKYLIDSLLTECRNQHTDIQMSDIKWVITVPAIWTDSAKTLMRSAAIEAGIDSDFLTIVLEPEAAAMCVKHLPFDRQVQGKLGDGFQTFTQRSKYLVLDAGGGTIDITAHEILEDGTVKELLTASGGSWGGTCVDECFMSFIQDVVGEQVITKVQTDSKMEMFEIFRDFELTKRKIRPHSEDKIVVRISATLAEVYKETNGRALRSLNEVKRKNGKTAPLNFALDKLRIDSDTANSFFAESVSSICKHLSELFKDRHGKDISTIIMVGGYSDSPVLVDAVRSKFTNKRVIVPYEAAWCVLKGAVIFGHDPSLISQRRSKYTYGVVVTKPFEEGIHDESKKYEIDGEVRCDYLFDKHVEVGQIVSVNEFQSDNLYGISSDFTFKWTIYASTLKNPVYTTDKDCFKVGVIKMKKFPIKEDSELRVQMSFGQTEIEVKVTNTKTGESSKIYLASESTAL